MESLRTKFGRRLREIRLNRALTQEQLAEAIGTSVEFVSLIERGISAPSFNTLEQLAAVLSVEVSQLFEFAADQKSVE
ncbi:MAG: hypothetical protein B6D42_05130 [Anaerolineae bacterium UTCFX5]|jgi:transcriptional regulator with XRE-family HTH domain|nr:MAG: hypothetical protein B6D42_05130 [Anaerolineae bacterium UTCFX5]